MIQNLHTHTTFCDGKHTAEAMVLSAIKKGLKSIGFSGHAPIENENWTMKNIPEYVLEINRLKEKYSSDIEIFLGLESEFLCEYPQYNYDYIISSVHGLKRGEKFLWVDADKKTVEDNLAEFYNGNVYEYIQEYYDLVVEASKKGDILGHFDLITKFNQEQDIFAESDNKYLEIAKKSLVKCIKNNIIIEINTGAMERGYLNRFYPAPYLLQTILENNGKIIINSDAHNENAIDFYYCESVKILKEIGFEKQMRLTKNGFVEVNL